MNNEYNLPDDLRTLIEITDYLDIQNFSTQLKRMEQALERKEYLLTFMGQFSAGKSRLINNLLGKTILPVHITETTALITFISYGEDEEITLCYKNGEHENISSEELLGIWQSGESSDKISKIEHISISVDSDLLKNGLIIADTPGINTIIKEHVALTANLLERSDRIVYVFGKAAAESDLTFIRRARDAGIDMMFVRTHMDELKSTEEVAERTAAEERRMLSEMTNDEMFFISNEETSGYYDNITAMREYLSVKLAENTEEALIKTISERTVFIAAQAQEALIEKKTNIDRILTGNREDYLEDKKRIEADLAKLEDILRKSKDRMKKKYEKTKEDAAEDLKAAQNRAVETVKRRLEEAKSSGATQERYAQIAEDTLTELCLQLQDSYLSGFDRAISENRADLEADLPEFSYLINVDIPDTLDEASEQTQEIFENIKALRILQDQLEMERHELDDRRADNTEKSEEIEKEKNMLEAAADAIQKELDSYPPYVAQYIETQSATNNHESTWRNIGKVLDLATLLIPGEGWAKFGIEALNIGAKGAKAVKMFNTAEKLGKAATIVSESVKVANTVNKADKAVDAVRIGKKFLNFSHSSKKMKSDIAQKAQNLNEAVGIASDFAEKARERVPSIFDYLSIEYHLANFGKKFDKPQVLEIDREYEEQYKNGKREIEQRLRQQTDAAYRKYVETLDIQEEQEKINLQRKLNAEKQQNTEKKITELEAKLKAESKEAKSKAICRFYEEAAKEKINDFCRHLRSETAEDIERKMTDYIETYDFRIVSTIDKKRNELDYLERQFDGAEKERLEKESLMCGEYLKRLQEILA